VLREASRRATAFGQKQTFSDKNNTLQDAILPPKFNYTGYLQLVGNSDS
jgi:hypothetical protein